MQIWAVVAFGKIAPGVQARSGKALCATQPDVFVRAPSPVVAPET